MAQVSCATDVRYRWECAACEESTEFSYVLAPLNEMPMPCLPNSWRVLNGLPYCPKHKIVMLVDGVVIE